MLWTSTFYMHLYKSLLQLERRIVCNYVIERANMKAPIVDAVFDIWFESKMLSEVLLGIIVENIEPYKEIKPLPLLQLPENIRLMDPNLKHQALYEILPTDKRPYKIVLGHNSLGIALNGEYEGWNESFFPEIQKLYGKIFEKGLIEKITRCGLRYVDFFQNENIYETGKVSVVINKSKIAHPTEKILLRIEKNIDDNIAMAVVINNRDLCTSQWRKKNRLKFY